MELWDVLDENGNKTGERVERGKPMSQHEYHLVVQIWIINNNNEFLISKRTPNKPFGNMWETTGGSAVTGDDSLSAAIREVKEELGLTLNPSNGQIFGRFKRQHEDFPDFADVWVFKQNFDIEEVILQPEETCDARWVTKDRIIQMLSNNEFIIWGGEKFELLDKLFEFCKV